MWKSKRGQSWAENVFVPVLQLLAVVMLLFLVMYRINAVTSRVSFDETYQARDIALLIDTLSLSPGEVYLNYDLYQPGNTILLEEGTVKAATTKQLAAAQAPTAYYVASAAVPVQKTALDGPFRIEKTTMIQFISDNTPRAISACNPIFFEQPKLIVVDPLYDAEGYAFHAATSLKSVSFLLPGSVMHLTTPVNQQLTEQERHERIPTNADMIIRLKHGGFEGEVPARAFVNQQRASYDFACSLLQQLHYEKNIQVTQHLSAPLVVSLELPLSQPDIFAQQLMSVLKSHIRSSQH